MQKLEYKSIPTLLGVNQRVDAKLRKSSPSMGFSVFKCTELQQDFSTEIDLIESGNTREFVFEGRLFSSFPPVPFKDTYRATSNIFITYVRVRTQHFRKSFGSGP
jgi:hypothetical protein